MEEKKTMLSPGDAVAYSEEFLPASGVYDDGERLRAAVFGEEDINTNTMELSIKPAGKAVARIEKGDIVLGEIAYIRAEFSSVKILGVRGKEGRSLLQQVEGTLHVSKSDQGYVADLTKLYEPGDVIRAKVIGLRGGPQLATDKPDFGVLRARSRDGHIMVKSGKGLKDPETGRQESRKLANDYGSGQV